MKELQEVEERQELQKLQELQELQEVQEQGNKEFSSAKASPPITPFVRIASSFCLRFWTNEASLVARIVSRPGRSQGLLYKQPCVIN